MLESALSQQIVDAFFVVYNRLGRGWAKPAFRRWIMTNDRKWQLRDTADLTMWLRVLFSWQRVRLFNRDAQRSP